MAICNRPLKNLKENMELYLKMDIHIGIRTNCNSNIIVKGDISALMALKTNNKAGLFILKTPKTSLSSIEKKESFLNLWIRMVG